MTNPLTACVLLAALSPIAALAQDITVMRDGQQVVLTGVPQKVAVFDLAALDTLHALGLDVVAGVPRPADRPGNFPERLTQFNEDRYAAVGGVFEPDLNALVALQPDLIIVGGRSRGALEAVSAIAPAIDLSAPGRGLAPDTITLTETLGQIFGAQEQAAEQIDAFETEVQALRDLGAEAGTGVVIFAAGQGYSVHAPGARFGLIHDLAGIASTAQPVESGNASPRPEPGSPEAEAARVKAETLLEDALAAGPDWIFALDRSAAVGQPERPLANRLMEDARIEGTPAGQQGQIITLDARDNYLIGAGLGGVLATTRSLTEAFRTAE